MMLTDDEKKKLKAMLLYMVKKRHTLSDGKSGFVITELNPILDELAEEGEIVKRPTINSNAYFLTLNNNNHDN